jgi:hypothetical protein
MTLQETITLAESPTTSPETLFSLYRDLRHIPEWHRSKIRKKIAGNPNIPATLVTGITHWHGRELFQNPVLPLLLMETPDLFQRANTHNLYRLLSWEETPKFLLNVLSQHNDALVAHEAQYHVGLHGEYADDSWIDEVKAALYSSTCETQKDRWVQYWHMCEALPSWLTQRLGWRPLPRPIQTTRVRPHVTEPAPTENEASQLTQLTDDELLALAKHPGQHPERLRLLIEIDWRPRPYNQRCRLHDEASNHRNVPQDLLRSGRIRANIRYYDKFSLKERLRRIPMYQLKGFTEELVGHRDANNALCRQALYRTLSYRSYNRYSPDNFPPSITFLALLRTKDASKIRFSEPDLWWHERLAAALHPETHPDVRAYIAKDSHRWVRAAARAAQADPNTWKRFWE